MSTENEEAQADGQLDGQLEAGIVASFGELFASSEQADFDKFGYHHKHVVGKAEDLPAIAQRFRDHGYILEMITCQDRREDLQKMRLVYGFNRLGATSEAADRHLLYADVDWGQEAETLCSVYKAANWHEREAYDMYGVRFAGHPELKRILLPDDVDYHALLKDFGRIEDAPEADPG